MVLGQHPLQQYIIFPTHKILHPRLDVVEITYVKDIPKNVWNRIEEKKDIQRHPICLTDADYDYILDEIECRDKIEFKMTLNGNNDKE